MNDTHRERVELLLSLKADGQLDESRARELDQLLSDSDELRQHATQFEEALAKIRNQVQAEADPDLPAGLREKILSRVENAREQARTHLRVLPLARSLAVAAALILCVGAFSLTGGWVSADDDPRLKVRTVEDEIQVRTDENGSIVEFLRWHFLRGE